jgi:hypothetical protein
MGDKKKMTFVKSQCSLNKLPLSRPATQTTFYLILKTMNTKIQSTLTKNSFLFLIGIMTIFLFESCARKIAFQASSIVPGAEGTVKVKKDNNSNYTIHVELSNLAAPGKLEPAMKTYVIWMETEQDPVKNIGQINSSSSFLSKRLKASFETVSSTKPTKIFITAENDGTIQYPGTQILATTSF